MKPYRIILPCLVIASWFVSCDIIEPPYTVPGPNGCTVSEPAFTPRPESERIKKVLIEDFTGHYCGVCPQAHVAIDNIISNPMFAQKIVAIAHHSAYAGDFTEPWPTDNNPQLQYIYDFRNPVSSELDYKYNGSAYPQGLVNRKDFGAGPLLDYNTWAGYANNLLNMPQEMDIQLKTFYDAQEESICTYYYAEALTNLTGNYKISLYLTENSIRQWQKNYQAIPVHVQNYEHKHVMRASFNGVYGTPLNSSSDISTGEEFINGFSISTSNTDWDIDNLYVVGFVYNATTEEIIQAEEVKVIP